jgi:hypothetical protein
MKKNIISLTFTTTIIFTFTFCKTECLKSSRCNLEPNAGPCKAAIPKYYFDKKEKTCKEFTWGGCGGVVPFETMEECKQHCYCK